MSIKSNIEFARRLMGDKLRFRWEVWDDLVESNLDSNSVWIDCGAGDNEHVERFGHLVKYAVGLDILPTCSNTSFIVSSIADMPFPSNFADLITMRFVVEHIDDIENTFAEIERVLKPDGRLIIMTSNIHSPLIRLSNFVPKRIKRLLILKLYNVNDNDVFDTHMKFNTPSKFKQPPGNLELKSLEYPADINLTSKLHVLIHYTIHRVLPIGMKPNLLGIFHKKNCAIR